MEHQRIFDKEMDELKDLILRMGLLAQELIHKAVESLKKSDRTIAQSVTEDEKMDQLELAVNEKCIQMVALRQPEASDLRFVMTAMRIANDLERIGDLAEDIAWRAIELIKFPLLKPLIDIPKMAVLAQDSVALVLDAFINRNAAKARQVWDKEKETDNLRDAIHDELIDIMTKDAATVPRAVPLLLIARHLERISDHATNIGEEVVYLIEGKVIKHSGG
ncbi:phosphate signaling complex protein PhoU [Candidatus Saganbacteria bacterium]|nr:phosphate signaling complex protein PhoU [Candidatus Saganbacteria bacterium]